MTDIVMIDANVLFKQNITDIILDLATQEIFSVKWTKQIETEWLQSKIKQRSKEKGKQKTENMLEAKLAEMKRKFPKAILHGYEHLIPQMTNHPKDRHVLAAAIHGECTIILTYNKKDFITKNTQKQKIKILTPDEFFLPFTNKNHKYFPNFIDALKTQLSYFTNPPLSIEEYLKLLAGDGQGMPLVARALWQASLQASLTDLWSWTVVG